MTGFIVQQGHIVNTGQDLRYVYLFLSSLLITPALSRICDAVSKDLAKATRTLYDDQGSLTESTIELVGSACERGEHCPVLPRG